MRFTVIFLLLSACASVPEHSSPYAAPGAVNSEPVVEAAVAPAMSAAPCVPYYTAANPPPLGLVPCPPPQPAITAYAYSVFPAAGYALYGTRGITPFRAPGHAGRTHRHTAGHTHAGRRGRK